MNLSLSNPQKYLCFFNSTLESCFYGKGYLSNFTAERGLIERYPKEMEFFMQLNFSKFEIFNEFNNLTNFFSKNYIGLINFENFTKNYREGINYFDESYMIDKETKYDYYTNKIAISFIMSMLMIIKSLFVAVVLIVGTFLFTKDISFLIISPLENLFAKLDILFNNLNAIHQQLELEGILDNENLFFEDPSSASSAIKKQKKSKFKYKNSAKMQIKAEEIKELSNKFADIELGKVNQENEESKKIEYSIIVSNEKNEKENELIERFKNKKIDNNQNNNNDNFLKSFEEENLQFALKEEKPISLELDKLDFSIMKLLDLISVSIGNPMLMMIPNCDLDEDLVINLKSSSVIFEGFALMLNISNKENLIQKIGVKANKYFNKVLSLFHSIGIIFCGQPYNTDVTNIIIWKNDGNSFMKNMFTYIQGLSI
jgi:hypothetical protein